jgi:hypothetical protein
MTRKKRKPYSLITIEFNDSDIPQVREIKKMLNKKNLSIPMAAHFGGVDKKTVYNWIKKGCGRLCELRRAIARLKEVKSNERGVE